MSSNIRKNIILCGFMGCGKTTVGKLLAQKLDIPFLDADGEIEDRTGKTIPQIFDAQGESGFRKVEHQVLAALLQERPAGILLSTGGGVCTYPPNHRLLRDNGVVVFLNPGFPVCYSRIRHTDRPIVRSNTREELEALYNDRLPAYRDTAHLEVAAAGDPEGCVAEILQAIET